MCQIQFYGLSGVHIDVCPEAAPKIDAEEKKLRVTILTPEHIQVYQAHLYSHTSFIVGDITIKCVL
jgi:hypothetical protein